MSEDVKEPNAKKCKPNDCACKELHFCLQPFATRSLPSELSEFVQALECTKATVCLTPNVCNHDGFVLTWSNDNVGNVTWEETIFLLDFLLHFQVATLPVNFQTILKLLDYLKVDLYWSQKLKDWLQMQTNFDFPISAISAYSITGKRQTDVPFRCMYEWKIPYLTRLQFCVDHNVAMEVYDPKPILKQDVASQLGIEEHLLYILDYKDCVLGGLASVQLGCPSVPFPLSTFVDFYFLKNGMSKLIEFTAMLRKTGRFLFSSESGGVKFMVAIGRFGTKSIQIIATDYKYPNHLVAHFAHMPECAFYDGTFLHPTIAALYCWETKTCCRKSFSRAITTNLCILEHLGFKLVPPVSLFPHDNVNSILNCIPYITSETEIPFQVQFELLHQLGFEHLENIPIPLKQIRFGCPYMNVCDIKDVASKFEAKFEKGKEIFPIVAKEDDYVFLVHCNVKIFQKNTHWYVSPKTYGYSILENDVPKQLLVAPYHISRKRKFEFKTKDMDIYKNGFFTSELPKKETEVRLALIPISFQSGGHENFVFITYRVHSLFYVE